MLCDEKSLPQFCPLQAALPIIWFLPSIAWLLGKLFPSKGFAVVIPSTYLRFLTFKLTADLRAVSPQPQLPKLHSR